MSHTRRGGGGDGKAVRAAAIDHQHTAAAERDEPRHKTRGGRCRGVFTMMNIRGMNVMVMSEGTISRSSAVMCGRLHN